MNLSIPKRFLLITASLYLGSFLFFLILNNIQFAQRTVDLYFKSGWIINRSLLQFFDYLIPVQSTAVLFTFSLFYPKVKSESGIEILTSRNFNHFVTMIVIILLALTALFFVGNEILKPRFHDKLDSYSYLTKTGRTYMQQATEAAEDGRLFDAESMIKHYLAIKPDDDDGVAFYNKIRKRIDNQYSASDEGGIIDTGDGESLNLSYDDAMRLARNYLDSEDFYSAYYYAQLASGLSSGSGDARSITSRAWTQLSHTAPSRADTEEFSLFSRKKRGTELLLGRKPIEAYYLFNQLNIEYPTDPDIGKYLIESIKETRKLTYFIDEAEDALNFPGITDICFLNTNEENQGELIFIGKMVSLSAGTFFENIESLSFDSNGPKQQMIADYGKLAGDYIILNGIDRENQNIRIYPEYLLSDSIPELYNTLKLNVDRNHLHGLSSSGNIYNKMSIIELIEFEPVIENYGWMVEPLYIEIISRILNPCGFIILSLLMIAIGWKYRRFAGKLPMAGLILSPVIIYITTLFTDSYRYAIKTLCTWIFLDFGKPSALILLVSSQIILLIIAFLLIASLGTGERKDAS